jgi:predicted dehydrogenase
VIPLRAAIVGAGLMGRWHAHAVARLGHTVAVVVDRDPARAAALASRYRGCEAAATFASAPAVDVVHVCTPVGTHVELARESIASGAHAIVEKPLADTAADTNQLLALAQSRGRLIVPVHQFVFQRGVQQAARALPALGPLLHVDFVGCTAGASHLDEQGRDRIAREILPHPLSLVARLVSPAIDAAEWHVRHPGAGEVRVDGVIGGITVSMLVSTGGRPTRNALRLIATHGTVRIDLYHGCATIIRGRATRTEKVLQPFVEGTATLASAATNLARRAIAREPAYPGLRQLIDRFYVAARSDGPAPLSPQECLAVAHTMDAIGARLNRGVSLGAVRH